MLGCEPFPKRVDELCNKRSVPFEFRSKRRMRAGWARLAGGYWTGRLRDGDGAGFGDETKADLATAGEFDVDLGEQLGVKQGAMFDAMAAVDPEPHAEGVGVVLGARVPGPR